MTLRELLVFAHRFDLHASQLSGPDWIHTEGFDITAQSKSSVSRPQLRRMLRVLLKDRFKLRFHREEEERITYWLVTAQGGPKLLDEKDGAEAVAARQKEGKLPFTPGLNSITKPCNMREFAERLGRPLDRPVLDKTGVQGRFWCQVEWEPDPVPEGTGDGKRQPYYVGPSLRSALEDQMGLRLEERIVAVDMLVIDHVERPSQN